MRSLFKKLTLITGLLLIASSLFAQTYYVRAGATGNGSDWNNAYGNLPATLVRGATYYIATGSYGFYTFDDAPSGTSVITIRKATVANHGTSAGWSDSYGIGTASWNGWEVGRPYYTFDGATRGSDWRSGYGFKVATGGLYGINLFWGGSSTAGNITIRYTEVQGRGLDNTSHDDGIYSPSGANNVLLQYCYIHDTGRCPILTGFSSGWTLEYSLIARNSSDPVYHSEGWASSADSNFIIRHNIFEDIEGTGYIICLNRGSGVNINANWEIYGNTFMYSEGNPYNREGCGDGAIAVINQQVAQNWKIYNNSFINIGPGAVGISARIRIGGDGQTGNSNVKIYNNFWWRSDSANHTLASCTGCEARWNRYDQTIYNNENDITINTTANTSTFVNYLTKNFRLSAATAPGTVLSSPYDVDLDGSVRGSDGLWDRGAYEFGGTTSTNVPPPPTTNPPPVITNTPPVVTNTTFATVLTSPVNGQVFTNNSNITLTATASGGVGGVASVEFYNSASRIGVDTSSPYSAVWSNVGMGRYSIYSLAKDTAGNVVTYGPSVITVTNIPIVVPPSNGCTNFYTNTITVTVPQWFTNTITLTNNIIKTNTVVITNTITRTLTNTVINNITNTVYQIPDLSSVLGTLDRTNKQLNIKVNFQ